MAVPPHCDSAKTEPSFVFCGVTFNRNTDTAAIDAEFTASVLRQIASGKYFELRSIE
jgi:hypothetical protein